MDPRRCIRNGFANGNDIILCLEDSSDGDLPAELVRRMQQMRMERMQEEEGASMGVVTPQRAQSSTQELGHWVQNCTKF